MVDLSATPITSAASISVVGLRGRYNERSDFLITTTPPVSEAAAPSSSPLFFPHIAASGGFTAQFILIKCPVRRHPARSNFLRSLVALGTGRFSEEKDPPGTPATLLSRLISIGRIAGSGKEIGDERS